MILISVLITAAILAGSFTLTTILIRELKISRDVDNAVLAVYGAESALEKGLFDLLKGGANPFNLKEAGRFSNGVTWTLEAQNQASERIFDVIKKDEAQVINLFNPKNNLLASGTESLTIDWATGQDLIVSVKEWNGSKLSTAVDSVFICGSSRSCTQIKLNNLSAAKAYEVKITPRYADAFEVKVKAWTADSGLGSAIALPIPVTISGLAKLGSVKQALSATLPESEIWVSPPLRPCLVTTGDVIAIGVEYGEAGFKLPPLPEMMNVLGYYIYSDKAYEDPKINPTLGAYARIGYYEIAKNLIFSPDFIQVGLEKNLAPGVIKVNYIKNQNVNITVTEVGNCAPPIK